MIKVAYICNRKRCGERCSSECLHTFDAEYAAFPKHLTLETKAYPINDIFEIGSYDKNTNELLLIEKEDHYGKSI